MPCSVLPVRDQIYVVLPTHGHSHIGMGCLPRNCCIWITMVGNIYDYGHSRAPMISSGFHRMISLRCHCVECAGIEFPLSRVYAVRFDCVWPPMNAAFSLSLPLTAVFCSPHSFRVAVAVSLSIFCIRCEPFPEINCPLFLRPCTVIFASMYASFHSN